MAAERDWTELNRELLNLIAKKLRNFSDFIRFRSVCKQWRISAADSPPQLPWVLQPATLTETGYSTKTDYILYSLSSRLTSNIEFPVNHTEYRYESTKEPSIGFILAHIIDQNRAKYPYLYNPLTENKIHLPFTKNKRYSLVCINPRNMSNSNTVKSGVHLVVCTHRPGWTEIGSWRSDANEFITFKIPFVTLVVGYYNGKVFAFNRNTRKTSAFDMTTGAEMNLVIPHPAECSNFDFFIEATGDLLAVQYPYWNNQFKVYQLDHTDDFGPCTWIKLKGIGERVLFLGRPPGGICLSASDFEGLRGNCIYYMKSYQDNNDGDVLHYSRILRYDMENGSSEELLNYAAESATWFLPSLSLP